MQVMHAHVAQYVVDHYPLVKNRELNSFEAGSIFHKLMILGPNFEFYVLDVQGNIAAYSADPSHVLREHVSTQPIDAYLNGGQKNFPVWGDDPRSLVGEKVFSAAKIVENNQLKGYLYVVLGSQIYDTTAAQVFSSHQSQWGFWVIIGGLGICFVMAIVLTRFTTNPLYKLTRRVKQQNENLLNSPEPNFQPIGQSIAPSISDSEEIRSLTGAFNQLTMKMAQQMVDLKSMHALQRELVAHISHDLRSPLASLMGYLETWQIQKDGLTAKQSEKYIGVALRNAKKMNRLIEQLFELAHLQSGDVKIQKEPFSIAELAQDVLQKFALVAQKKNVALQVTPKETHFHVLGDIEKLERVLSNLVENALRHTEPGGAITIRLSSEGRLVGVEVVDTGIGIPKQELGKIFNAHYKAENSVRGKTANGGLGLAITKKLLSLHNASISVKSECGRGTSFRFSLQCPAPIS